MKKIDGAQENKNGQTETFPKLASLAEKMASINKGLEPDQSLAAKLAKFSEPLQKASMGFGKALAEQQKQYEEAMAPLARSAKVLKKIANPPMPDFDIPSFELPIEAPTIVPGSVSLGIEESLRSIEESRTRETEHKAMMDQIQMDTLNELETIRDFLAKEAEYRVKYDTKQAEYNRNRDTVAKNRHKEAMGIGKWTLLAAVGAILVPIILAIYFRPLAPIVNVNLRSVEEKLTSLIQVTEKSLLESTKLRNQNRQLKRALLQKNSKFDSGKDNK